MQLMKALAEEYLAVVYFGTSEGITDEDADRETEDEYIAGLIASGEYQNSREIITDALRLLIEGPEQVVVFAASGQISFPALQPPL